MKTKTLCLCLLIVMFCCGGVFAQETATILGTVKDSTGAVVPNVNITITNTATGQSREIQTNGAGNFSAPNLSIGNYSVRVTAAGFNSYQKSNIPLNVNDTVRVDVPLQIGEAKQSVEVQGNAVQVQSDTSEVSAVVSGTQITDLDTNGRNPIQLAALVPGAASSVSDFNPPTALSSNNNVSFNGQRPAHNLFLIDGGESADRGGGGGSIVSPSPDALAEFKVLTANAGAEFGLSSAATISMALKSGTRAFHGGAWEFNRNDALGANNYFANLNNQAKPKLNYNAYGFNIGGPVTIPHVYNTERNKTFFFYNQEWRKLRQGSQINVLAVPGAQQSGDFSSLPALKVPDTQDPAQIARFAQFGLTPGGAFPGNKIPAGLIDPNAAAALAAGVFPKPNSADGLRYLAAAPTPTDLREEIVRIDHQINDKLTLTGHLIYDSSVNTYATTLWSGSSYPNLQTVLTNPSYTSVIHLTHSISAAVVNEVSWNYNGNAISIVPKGLVAKPAGWTSSEYFPENALNRLPSLILADPYNVSYQTQAWPWHNWYKSNQFRDDLSITRGAHNLKFGGSWMHNRKNQDIFGQTNGNFNFNGKKTGNSFSDFLLGYASSYDELDLQDAVHIATNDISIYAVDNWRASSRLTLNLGLRWEGKPHAYDLNNRLANFQPSAYNPANAPQFNSDGSLNSSGAGFSTTPGIALSNVPFYLNGIALAGKNGTPSGLVQNHWLTFAPRVGFAYDLTGNQKTIVRGGFGIFYERIQGNDVYNMGGNAPFSFDPAPSNVYLSNPAISNVTGLKAATPTFPGNITSLAFSDYKLPTSMQYNFSIQHQLSENAFFTVAYVGAHDSHQPVNRSINTVPLNDPNRAAILGGAYNPNLDRAFRGFANITETETSANANYNSLQLSLRTQSKRGLTLQAAYTYSHSLDTLSGDLTTTSNPFNTQYDYGSSDFDRRHVAIFSYVYELPIFKNTRNAFAHSVLGGWSISGITVFETGNPINIALGSDNLGLGGGTTSRPNAVGPITYTKSVTQWFNPTAFAQPALLAFGTAARNSVAGPGRQNWNTSVYKAFRFPFAGNSEGAKFELRFETYNTFNHTQFNGINNTFGNAGFGAVNSTFDPRVIQLGGKFSF